MTKRLRRLVAGLTIAAAAVTGTALTTQAASADPQPADSTWHAPADSTWSTPTTADATVAVRTAITPLDSTW